MSEVTAARRDLWLSFGVIAAVLAAALAKPLWQRFAARPTPEACDALLDRYLEHASRQHVPDADDDDIDRALASSREGPERERDLIACQRELTAEQVTCGLQAPNVDELERCVQ